MNARPGPAEPSQLVPPSNAALGRAIRRLRQQQRQSIEALALNAGLHPTYLSGIERGQRNPTWAKLCALASTLQVTMSTMVGEAEHDTCPVCGAPRCEASSEPR